ncbi:6-phosphogluconolactonase [Pelagicoccus sp. SDUM812003]|uniref:6-phosphogluconolactonase n=1 Tax=Pelagicoccus sp. SDUM812003 TaxID=3041267 RepID=UPI0028103B40|nr:6-phosphogluconolactonase [Pelagicoccus sp. SDUM812003]MDQ8202386.1 6-phosphogluconolactonase [Pelagicoccus sp. SDUM812003]
MNTYQTEYGTVKVGPKDELFQEALALACEHFESLEKEYVSWALTGGSTPKDFYKWVVENECLPVETLDRVLWTTSDERTVPLESEENNFGNADRLMLRPLETIEDSKFPWPTELEPHAAAEAYSKKWDKAMGKDATYDVCFVGMGDDCHTLSLFPGSPLISNPVVANFAAVEVPGKGWRLTLTPYGLAKCGTVVLMTLGAGKADALKAVLQGDYDPVNKPSQSLKAVADRAYWLVDEAAAAKLDL